MVKKASYSAEIEKALGVKPRNHPREDYQETAHIVWWIMRNIADKDENAQPKWEDGRAGYVIRGMGPVQAIEKVWPNLSANELSSARGQVVKALTLRNAGHVITPGRKNTPSVWWVASTFEPAEDGSQPPEPAKLPTDWKPGDEPTERAVLEIDHANNGVEILGKVIELPETGQTDSVADRVTKAQEILDDVILELQSQITDLKNENRALADENAKLARHLETLNAAYRQISTD